MNILSSCSLICTASFVYSKRKTLGGAIIGLVLGVVTVTLMMSLWNYIVTPIYRGFPRALIKPLIIPVFAAFNFFKSGLNAVITLMLFKPLATALHKADLIEPQVIGKRSTSMKWAFVATGVILVTVVLIFVLKFDVSLLTKTKPEN
jgi:hypothetical protein